ncbi:origin recognition complex subunit 2 [Cryptococcus neoformans Tu259-1]|uniref:Origin recognition complex subunit 2 n=1 Tax=Cryptococcus neoformans Tu259-1 TaxID=1230072 RepID=A0A854QHA9_CRYNE|nr:origin recognition complex subunit 2 [Cryptococcus neoformans var. grubii Tu259-1]
MPPTAKRPRQKSPRPENPEARPCQSPDPEASASHLVSFLSGYADHQSDEEENEHNLDDDDADRYEPSDQEEDAEDGVNGEEEETRVTPRKMGLLPASVTSTPRSKRGTPKKRKPGSITPTSRKTPVKTPKRPPLLAPADGEEEDTGIIRASKADGYFTLMAQSSKTSGNSYSLLADPLSKQAYERYIAESSEVRATLIPPETFTGKFHQWEKELEAGFNLLFYGFGSKRQALNLFVHNRLAKKGHVVVINGFFPGLSIRDVLSEVEDRLEVPQNVSVPTYCSTPLERAAHRIYAYLLPPAAIQPFSQKHWPTASAPLYLMIHNIDAQSLRTPRSIATLSLLASSPRIHIIASFDHVHTPIIFSTSFSNSPPHSYPDGGWIGTPQKDRGFNWIHHSLTTYAPYDLELSYLRLSAQSLTPSGSGTGGISEEGALQILKSVPVKAARLLKLTLTQQLSRLPSHPKWHVAYPAPSSGSGIAPPFAVDGYLLNKTAKDKFIATEDERFEAFIGEYKDHGLVAEASVANEVDENHDGTVAEGRKEGRWFWVPLGKAAIERILQSMEDIES